MLYLMRITFFGMILWSSLCVYAEDKNAIERGGVISEETGDKRSDEAIPDGEYLIDYLMINNEIINPLIKEKTENKSDGTTHTSGNRGGVSSDTNTVGKHGLNKYAYHYSLNAFGSVSLVLHKEKNEHCFATDLYDLLEKIDTSYIVRAQIRTKGSDDWRAVALLNGFSRVITKQPIRGAEAIDIRESSFGRYDVVPEFFEYSPYFKDGTLQVTIDRELIKKIEDNKASLEKDIEAFMQKYPDKKINTGWARNTRYNYPTNPRSTNSSNPPVDIKVENPGDSSPDLDSQYESLLNTAADISKIREDIHPPGQRDTDPKIAAEPEEIQALDELQVKTANLAALVDKRRYLESRRDIFTFHPSDCFILNNDDQFTYYTAKDGDELRIQIFKTEYILSDESEAVIPSVPMLETPLYFVFRDYGTFVNFSPALFYVGEVLDDNFNSRNYNPFQKAPGYGLNVYLSYTGSSAAISLFANWLCPSLSIVTTGYYGNQVSSPDGPIIEKYVDPEFSVGISWSPPVLRDIFNLTGLLYDMDLDHFMFGFSVSPKVSFDLGLTKNETEAIKEE